MMQSRTHTCGQLRIENAGEHVTLVGWMENVRVVGNNFAFLVLRDFYGTTQIVVETEEIMSVIKGINKESTISVTGTVRERASKNPKLPTGDIEVVPERIELLGRCQYNELPFEINRSRDADETQRLKYRYLDLRNPAVKKNIILRCNVIAALRKAMMEHDFLEYAETLNTEEIEDIISKLTQVKETRADKMRCAAAQKVKDAIDEYLKLGEEIFISGEVWSEKYRECESIEATFEKCHVNDGRLTFFIE